MCKWTRWLLYYQDIYAVNQKTLYSSGLLIKAAWKAAYHDTRTKSALTREAKAKAIKVKLIKIKRQYSSMV
jgi:hypothetical protein